MTTRNDTPKRDARNQMNKTPASRLAHQLEYVRLGSKDRASRGIEIARVSYRAFQVAVKAFVRTIYVSASPDEKLAIRCAFRQARADYDSIEVPRG